MHPVKFSRWCPLFFPTQATRRSFVFVRAGWGWVFASRGLQLDRPALSLCSALFLSPVSSGTPLVHRSFLTDGVQGWRVVDLDAARRRRAASSGDGRLPAAAAAPDAARPAQPSIDNPGRAANRRPLRRRLHEAFPSPPETILRLIRLYTGTSNMDKINSGRLQQVTIGLGW